MKNYKEITTHLLERRVIYEADQAKKRKRLQNISASCLCFCIVAFLGIGVWQKGMLDPDIPTLPVQSTAPSNAPQNTTGSIPEVSQPTQPIIWGSENEDHFTEDAAFATWNNKWISFSLYDALTNPTNQDSIFAIAPSFVLDTQYAVNGKTIADYALDAEKEEFQLNQLYSLLKLGEYLKYGDALYQTGTPDGEKWDKGLYDKTVAGFGKELLEKYIVDGVFLKDKVEADIAAYDQETAHVAYNKACEAYYQHIAKATAKELEAINITCEYKEDTHSLVIYATIDEFASLSIDDAYFFLATQHSGDWGEDQTYAMQCDI